LPTKFGRDQTAIGKNESGGKRMSIVELIELENALGFGGLRSRSPAFRLFVIGLRSEKSYYFIMTS
jgi:hypothetical protein